MAKQACRLKRESWLQLFGLFFYSLITGILDNFQFVFVRQDGIIVKRSFLALSDGKPENLPVIMHSNFKFYTVGLQLIFL